MASYYDRELCTGNGIVSEEAFVKAWRLRACVVGKLQDRKIVRAALICVGTAAGMMGILGMLDAPIAGILFVVSAFGLFGSIYLLPRKMEQEARKIYQSGEIFSLSQHLRITEEGFELTNAYEKLTGYWSETAFCAEDAENFVFCDNRDRTILILPKEWLDSEVEANVSRKMKEIFLGRYQCFGHPSKKME